MKRLLWLLYSSRLLMIAGYWRTRMTNFFIISVLNWQNENGKIRERYPSLPYIGNCGPHYLKSGGIV